MEKIGIENIKLALEAIIAIVNNIKLTKKPLLITILSIGKIVKIKFKQIGSEIKDLDSNEKEELVNFIIQKGFPKLNALKVIENLGNGTKIRPRDIAKQLIG